MATVKFSDEMPKPTSIKGTDRFLISDGVTGEAKAPDFNQAKEYLNITGIEMEPLVGGTTSGTALVVPNGPAGEQRTAEVSSGKWYDFGSGPVQASADRRWKSYWSGTSWVLKDMGELPQAIADGDVNYTEERAPSGRTTAIKTILPFDIGVDKVIGGTNVISELLGTDLNDTNIWGVGYINKNTGNINETSNTDYRYSIKYYPVFAGVTYLGDFNQGINNVGYALYDSNKTRVSGGNAPNDELTEITPSVDGFLRFSIYTQFGNTGFQFTVKNTQLTKPSNKVFIPTEERPEIIKDSLLNVGYEERNVGYNILTELNPLNLNDSSIWKSGYYELGGGIDASSSWKNTIIPIKSGAYYTNNFISGSARYVMFDSQMNYLGSYESKGNVSGTVNWDIIIETDGFLGISQAVSSGAYRDPFFIRQKFQSIEPTSDIFLKSNEANDLILTNINNRLFDFGFETYPVGTNFISELTGSNLADTSLWLPGYVNDTGGVINDTEWKYSVKKYPLGIGQYDLKLFFRGNAKVLIFDSETNDIIEVLSNSSTPDLYESSISILKKSLIQISHRQAGDVDRINQIHVTNSVEVPKDIKVDIGNVSNEIIKGSSNPINSIAVNNNQRRNYKEQFPARSKTPMISFIADDGSSWDYTWYKSVLDDKDVRSTFAIISGQIGTSNRMTKAQIKTLYAEGHDIAAHTHQHINLTTLTLNQVEQDLIKCKSILLDIVNEVDMFIAPQGGRTPAIDNIIRKYFKNDFISGYNEGRNPLPLNTYFINRVSFDAQSNGVLHIESLKAKVDECKTNKEWMIFAIHPQYPEYGSGNPVMEQRRAELGELLDYINEQEIPILTAKQAYKYWANYIDLGLQGYGDFYKLGIDHSESGNLI